jgi:farnesyl diphosphate synthase
LCLLCFRRQDIKDHKCSWLVVQALRLCTPEQRKTLEANYGKEDDANVAAVKKLYRDLQLEHIYEEQEEASKVRVEELIERHAAILPPGVFMPVLVKIHKREK